jgi:hypothetical protein
MSVNAVEYGVNVDVGDYAIDRAIRRGGAEKKNN